MFPILGPHNRKRNKHPATPQYCLFLYFLHVRAHTTVRLRQKMVIYIYIYIYIDKILKKKKTVFLDWPIA